MAWSTPTSRSAGYTVPHTEWNQNTVDNPIAVRTGAIALTSQATGSIPHASSASQFAVTSGFTFDGTTLAVPNGIKERGRSVVLGEFTAVAHAGGNFTAASGTWTVESGDQITFGYSLVGKMITVIFTIATSSVSATPATLSIAIPGSFTAAKAVYNAILIADNSTRTMGTARVAAAGTTIVIERMDAGNFSAATNATSIVGQITFEVS